MPANEDMIVQVQPLVPALRRYARAMLRDREDADDLVQDVLERAIGAWRSRHEAGSLRSWLFAIMHNLALDRLRRHGRKGSSQPLDLVPELHLATPATQELAVQTSTTNSKSRSISDLSHSEADCTTGG